MATKEAIAIVRETALHALKENSAQVAALLSIEPPNLDMYFHDTDLQQAEELKALAAFNERVVSALETQLQPVLQAETPQKKKVSNGRT